MKIFLDANILVSVLNKEYPVFTYTSRIMSLADRPHVKLFTSPICLAISFYFSEKKSGRKSALSKMDLLCQHLHITSVDDEVVRRALENPFVVDFEDGLEYYSAIQAGCEFIITEDPGDFYFSDIPVIRSEEFLIHYAYPRL